MQFIDLSTMVKPRKIAIIGASEREGSHARNTYENIVERSNFNKEDVYLVNPGYDELLGEKCYKSVTEIESDEIDVAIILVRAELVARVTKECADKNIPFAVIMSSGFKETGESGLQAEQDLIDVIETTDIRVYGPNCPGFTDINRKLGLTFSRAFAYDNLGGTVGLVTQGGGIGRTILQGQKRGIGFGYFFSTGNEIDLELSDFIYYMLNDPSINVIATVVEGFKDGDKFRRVAELALEKKKPIVILKMGKSELGQKASLSHTGALTGSDRVFEALCKQYGIIRVDDIDELLETSSLFARGKVRDKGSIAIVSGSGGSGTLVADLVGEQKLDMAQLHETTVEKLTDILPPFASLANPIDLTGSFLEDDGSLHHNSLEVLAKDPDVDIIIEPINANYGETSETICQSLVEIQKNTHKIIVPVWMSSMDDGGYLTLEEGGLVPFRSIRNAVLAINNYVTYGKFQKEYHKFIGNGDKQLTVSSKVPSGSSRSLNEYESKQIIKEAGIQTANEALATTEDEAVKAAESIGYPVVLKIVSEDIPHKTESGGIKLNIADESSLREAYKDILTAVESYNPHAKIDGILVSEMVDGGLEVILGLQNDPQFGSVVLVGMGGVQAEILDDVQLAVSPITKAYAKEMIQNLQSAALFNGYRNQPVRDVEALATAVEQLSILGASNKHIAEVDINPILVMEESKGVKAIDALVVVTK